MLGCIGCLTVTLFAFVSSAPAESLSGCVLQGTATFSPAPNPSTATSFSYTFGATLSNCQASPSAPESGTIEAGQTLTEHVTNSITGATDSVMYQEWPVPSGEGTCANSTTTGRALVTWADGTHTVEIYTTKGGLVSAVTGGVDKSMTLRAVNAQEGDPNTYTIKTNRFVSTEPVDGLLSLQQAACNTSGEVTESTTAGISGIWGVASR
jgi:hypothetical protein